MTCRLSRDSGRVLAIVDGVRGVRHLKKLPCGTSTRLDSVPVHGGEVLAGRAARLGSRLVEQAGADRNST